MKLLLRNMFVRLGAFTLELDVEITSATTAIFGPSGAGKTSLLDIIAGLRRAECAHIELNGQVLTTVPARHRRLGYVPQDLALFPHLTVRRNLLYASPAGIDAHVLEALEIAPLLDRSIANLSGGEKQRVALGRALLASPKLLLLDEPLSSLDFTLKQRLIPYLKRIRDDFHIPMLYVTHDPDEVAELCGEVLVLERGRCIARGTPSDVFERTTEPHYRLRC